MKFEVIIYSVQLQIWLYNHKVFSNYFKHIRNVLIVFTKNKLKYVQKLQRSTHDHEETFDCEQIFNCEICQPYSLINIVKTFLSLFLIFNVHF